MHVGQIGVRANFLPEGALRRLIGHVHALSGDVEFPTMVQTADPVLLVAPDVERRKTMRAELIHDPHTPFGVSERHEVLTQNADPLGLIVDFRGPKGARRAASNA